MNEQIIIRYVAAVAALSTISLGAFMFGLSRTSVAHGAAINTNGSAITGLERNDERLDDRITHTESNISAINEKLNGLAKGQERIFNKVDAL